MALMEGADEIDIVISVGKFLAGDYEGMCEMCIRDRSKGCWQ